MKEKGEGGGREEWEDSKEGSGKGEKGEEGDGNYASLLSTSLYATPMTHTLQAASHSPPSLVSSALLP